jgi:16S rRNA G966 N2-methylase RsmD
VQLIGRSRKQKIVLGRDWLLEAFELDGRQLRYQQLDGSFTQPNGGVNRKMLGWARARAAGIGGDLLELYCGNGNFTVALAPLFGRVLATEMSKPSVRAAEYNLEANGVANVTMVRMASDEISDALAGGREYRRMKDVDLAAYNFTTLFVDPPAPASTRPPSSSPAASTTSSTSPATPTPCATTWRRCTPPTASRRRRPSTSSPTPTTSNAACCWCGGPAERGRWVSSTGCSARAVKSATATRASPRRWRG